MGKAAAMAASASANELPKPGRVSRQSWSAVRSGLAIRVALYRVGGSWPQRDLSVYGHVVETIFIAVTFIV